MLALLPLFTLAAFLATLRRDSESWRDALLATAVVWGVILVAITEVLSAFHALAQLPLAIAWTLAATVAIWVMRRRGKSVSRSLPLYPFPTDGVDRLLLGGIAVVLLVTFFSALVAAPSTADSMTYHLARVAHWLQNRSVAFYPTHIERQLWPGPGGNLVVLHLMGLAGSDRVATLVQWLAYVGCISMGSQLASQVGAGRRGQLWAAFFVAMIPGAVAQASGTQVELVLTFWLCCTVSAGLRLRSVGWEARSSDWAVLGAAIGLSVLTKATAYLFLAPFLLWFVLGAMRSRVWRAARGWAVAATVALAVVAPHYARNINLYGRPLGKPGTNGEVNAAFLASGLVSNVVRNVALHLGTRSPAVNEAVFRAIQGVHRVIGINEDDRRTKFLYGHFGPQRFEYAEQTASAPLSLLLIAAAAVVLMIRLRSERTASYLLAATFVGFLLFCFYLKWQPWHSRLVVPLMILAAPAVGLVLDRTMSRSVRIGIAAALFVAMLPALLINPYRPLVYRRPIYTLPREEKYFTEDPRITRAYVGAADYLASRRCSRVAFWFRGDGFEYQMWALLRNRFPEGFQIRHVLIRNASRKLPGERFAACALVYVHPEVPLALLPLPVGASPAWERDDVRIYEPPATGYQLPAARFP